jgi:hypothetical protein
MGVSRELALKGHQLKSVLPFHRLVSIRCLLEKGTFDKGINVGRPVLDQVLAVVVPQQRMEAPPSPAMLPTKEFASRGEVMRAHTLRRGSHRGSPPEVSCRSCC